MAEPELIQMRPPESVTITQATGVRFTPNELRALKAETGRTMTELLGPDADDGDRMQTLAWLSLRREGHPLAWESCADIEISVQDAGPPDPTSGGLPTSLPGSAGSGA
jgi:hypothetical protein